MILMNIFVLEEGKIGRTSQKPTILFITYSDYFTGKIFLKKNAMNNIHPLGLRLIKLVKIQRFQLFKLSAQ